jgi:hypothetical protein
MTPADLSNALLYGIPFVLYTSMYQGFDSILGRRMRPCRERGTTLNALNAELPMAGNAALHIAVAKSQEQFKAAGELVRKRYAWRGYDVDQSSDEPSSREITFLVESAKTTVGTLTLGFDGPLGLCAEASYGDVIERFRRSGHRVCELTRLALAENADSKAVLSSLFSLAHAVGRTLHDVTHVFIEINPRHVAFYSRVLGFVVEASGRFCERVRAPSTLLHVEIEALERRLGLIDLAARMQPLEEAA